MGCETGHISHLCAHALADAAHTMCHNLLQSPPHAYTHARAHTLSDYSLASIIFKRKACSHMNRYRSGVSNTSVCVRVCVYVYRLFQNQAYAQHTHNLSTQKPEHTRWICSLSTAACFIAPVETSPSSTFLFNMQGINCLHDKLQPSQLRPCDIYTRVVYKHRCGNIISGFVWRMSRESSVLYALMNHAVTSFHTSSNTFGICAEWASARTSCLIMVMWLFTHVMWSLWHVFGIYMKANISAV